MNVTYESPKVDGPAVYRRWTLVAADVDGVPTGDIGSVTQEVERRFSMRDDAQAYADGLRNLAIETSGPTPIACRYHGPTDSPSNAWVVRGEAPLADPADPRDAS